MNPFISTLLAACRLASALSRKRRKRLSSLTKPPHPTAPLPHYRIGRGSLLRVPKASTKAPLRLQQSLHNVDGRRSHENHEDSGEDEQNQGEEKLNGGLGRLLFRQLLAPRPHRVGLHTQGLGDTRTEAVRLDQDGRQRADIIDAGADAEVVENFATGPAHLQLEVRQRQLFANRL